MDIKKVKKGVAPYFTLMILGVAILLLYSLFNTKIYDLTYDEFEQALSEGVVSELTLTPSARAYTYTVTGKLDDYNKNESFTVTTPLSDETVERILLSYDQNEFKILVNDDPESGFLLTLVVNLLPYALIAGIAMYIFTRQANQGGKSFDFGKSKARLSQENNKVTFKDVAGLTEEKEELRELIDFLKNPKKFQKLGARIPKGVLLVGPPGTGKTLLAKAVAGEANAPFYFISGSDFVELFVGIGASRVRDMFKQAKQTAPCLIFIDEIDAVGRERGTGLGGGHDEREQTLNQLLTEMDGFGTNEGIIIIAATNRADVLDPALLRPGRFDRQVIVNLPDAKAREEILAVHAKNKIIDSSVTLEFLAQRTVGFSGADLENLLNEAALLAVRRNKDRITMDEIDEATDRVLMGPAKHTKKYSDKEKSLVAHHEAGHVVLGLKLDDANDVQKVTIIPRGYAGGYAIMTPKEDRTTATKQELLERITGLLGGRVAEEVIFNEVTTGAHNDFEQATKIARAMVTEYGMSSLGPVQLESRQDGVFLGRDYNKSRNFSDQVALEIDVEIRKIINECYENAKKIITENLDLLELIADKLIKYETITKEQIEFLVENGCLPCEKEEYTETTESLTLAELKEKGKGLGIKGCTKMNKDELLDKIKKGE